MLFVPIPILCQSLYDMCVESLPYRVYNLKAAVKLTCHITRHFTLYNYGLSHTLLYTLVVKFIDSDIVYCLITVAQTEIFTLSITFNLNWVIPIRYF